jgi:hypothetical protein
MPAGVWTAVARPTGTPSGSVVWNTNLMSNPNDGLDAGCSLGASSLGDFFDAGLPPAPDDPLTACEDGEIDDQPVYPIPPDIEYVRPPRFEITTYDCRDLRLIIVPAGTWGPKGAGPSNPRLFTITGFEVAYLLDPIVEDDTSTSGGPPDGRRKGTISGGDTRLLWWGHQNNAGSTWQGEMTGPPTWPRCRPSA